MYRFTQNMTEEKERNKEQAGQCILYLMYETQEVHQSKDSRFIVVYIEASRVSLSPSEQNLFSVFCFS